MRDSTTSDPLTIAFLLFPNLTQLDLTGPAQFLSRAGATLHYVAASRDPVPSDAGFSILPTATFADVPAADVLVVPGGLGVADAIRDDALIAWVAAVGAEARWVTSVCTGSLILGAAGLLDGYRATSHWAWVELLPLFGATHDPARVVIDRNRVTGGGVTAGIDFGLTLLARLRGEDHARAVQLSLEYDPAPPFDSGSPERAGPVVTARVERASERAAPGRKADLRDAAKRRGWG